MHLSALERDLLGDLAQDSHELWEIYAFVRSSHPNLENDAIVRRGNELIASWVSREWLKAFRSRSSSDVLSGGELLAEIDGLGPQASDPAKGKIVLQLTDRASRDVKWLSKSTK
jgi:hypothetical protein